MASGRPARGPARPRRGRRCPGTRARATPPAAPPEASASDPSDLPACAPASPHSAVRRGSELRRAGLQPCGPGPVVGGAETPLAARATAANTVSSTRRTRVRYPACAASADRRSTLAGRSGATSVGCGMADVAVLGLGRMGSALARTLVASGAEVVVWNRAPERTGPLAAAGATVAATPAVAVAAAPLVVACLDTYGTTAGLLAEADVAGRTIVELATGTPAQAAATA